MTLDVSCWSYILERNMKSIDCIFLVWEDIHMLKMSEMFTPCGKEYGSFICRDLSLDSEKY